MDRFRWCSGEIEHRGYTGFGGVDEEAIVLQQTGVRLYDGPHRTEFDHGMLQLTTHRLLWMPRPGASDSLALPLAAVVSVRSDEGGGLIRSRSPKLILRLLTVPALANVLNSLPHPLSWVNRWLVADDSTYNAVERSEEDHIRLGFTRAGHREFERALNEVLQAKVWAATLSSRSGRALNAVGIGAIQRDQAASAGATDRSIAQAFDDLNQLIRRASEMVGLSQALAKQARETKGLSTDEASELRAAMLSMGVIDELSDHRRLSSSSSFHTRLAHQLSDLLHPLLSQRSRSDVYSRAGCIDLASAYCRINRARGMQLISPDDLLRACHLLEKEQLPVRLKAFSSGLLVLHLASENESETLKATADLVNEHKSLTPDELSRLTGVSLLLTRERLLAVEEAGLVCRDDSEAGLRFYPNWFITGAAS